MRRVDVLLDVDGVISPLSHTDPGGRSGWWPAAIHVRPARLACWVAPQLVTRLNTLTDRDGVTAYWLTSWRHDAPAHLAPAIGLRAQHWPVLDAPDTETDRHSWWKADAVAAHLAVTDADLVVWVDDDIDDWAGDQPHRPRLLEDPRLVTVCPNVHAGLTPALMSHLDRLVDGRPAAP